jgi:hypothetical protein
MPKILSGNPKNPVDAGGERAEKIIAVKKE